MLWVDVFWGVTLSLSLSACAALPASPHDGRTRVSPPASVPEPPQRGNTTVASFTQAKRLLEQLEASRSVSFYCNCRYQGKRVLHGSCGYVPLHPGRRADRIEWEHVVAAARLGGNLPSWRRGDPACVSRRGKAYKGRRCARRVSASFRFMEADLYNLVPVIGELNALRSNYEMGRIEGEARRFGACDVEIADGVFEPRPAIRGDIARIVLYMAAAYPGRHIVSPQQRERLHQWSRLDPVDEVECRRAREIARLQGNVNGFVEPACRRIERPSRQHQ